MIIGTVADVVIGPPIDGEGTITMILGTIGGEMRGRGIRRGRGKGINVMVGGDRGRGIVSVAVIVPRGIEIAMRIGRGVVMAEGMTTDAVIGIAEKM